MGVGWWVGCGWSALVCVGVHVCVGGDVWVWVYSVCV